MFDALVGVLRQTVSCPSALSCAELVEALAGLGRFESAVAERKLAMIAELTQQRTDRHVEAGGWTSSAVEGAEAEIGAALTVARAQAGRLIGTAMTLRTRLPRVREALTRGELDPYRVTLIDQATCNVTDEVIGEVERQVLDQVLAPAGPGGTGLTGRRLVNAVTRIVDRVDPAGVRQRRDRARTERGVGISSAEDGMVRIFGSLPAEDGRRLDGRLRELANTVCPHDPRTLDQRRADAVGALVDGLAVLPCRCGRADCTQDPGQVPVARKPLVHVIMLDSTHTGADDEPGYLDGYGLIGADHAREIAADAEIAPVRVPDDVTAERAHRAAGGAPATEPGAVAADPPPARVPDPLPASAFTYHPTGLLDTWIRILAGTCQWLHCDVPAWHTDLDHDEPFDHRDPRGGGQTVARNLKPYCRNHHRLKHTGDWTETHHRDRTIELTAPTGHRYRTRTAGYLDILGIDPDHVTGPDRHTGTRRRRRTRAENKAARIRAERGRRQRELDEPPPF